MEFLLFLEGSLRLRYENQHQRHGSRRVADVASVLLGPLQKPLIDARDSTPRAVLPLSADPFNWKGYPVADVAT